jgi:RNA polymerase sigma-70 factor (ECF subfamily)
MPASCRPRPGSLAERFRHGDPRALTEIYHRYQRPMFATALSLLGSHDLAADAVQQAFVRAWRAAPMFDPSRELRPWLYAIVRRTAVDVHRQQRRFGGTVPIDAVPEQRTGVHTGSLEGTWLAWQVRTALGRLHRNDRAVLRLAYFESLTHTEIAEALDIPVGTVKSRISRAHRRLASLLDHLADD